jgi:hypothetical protein
MADEQLAEKGLGSAVMICEMCTFAIALKLTAVLSGAYHGSINPFTNSHHCLSSHP